MNDNYERIPLIDTKVCLVGVTSDFPAGVTRYAIFSCYHVCQVQTDNVTDSRRMNHRSKEAKINPIFLPFITDIIYVDIL